ncbi:tripartite tricarboxylate transporter substrate binding protein [Oceanispirochaeta crateris]|uniref:Tripartite tricarboxylate transporter substrate binding protein n=1 Tax=Oceanispirochaeta crateris TaxID=2518645 RepID=A0A5C1QRN5_9SPIO|nr:tripartite tricarboxylate transporter substrate-binding protein [Oceanispirochaeta crateris]QEN09640.1 tripartite tricarboxylate transporter substrate binding protein [Oceanispirochaeta crateris]
MRRLLAVLSVVFLTSSIVIAEGQNDKSYPTKDIQFISAGNAGGGADALSRKICSIVQKDLGEDFYIVNKGGSSDANGPSLLMKAKPDGYTVGQLLYGSCVSAVYDEVLPGYDLNDLEIFGMVSAESDSFVAGKHSGITSFEDLIAKAKAAPNTITVADQGAGSRTYMIVRQVEEYYGVKFNNVSYPGSGNMREAILNKELAVGVNSLGDFSPIIDSGDAIGLVEFSSKTNGKYTDVPVCSDLGMPAEMQSGSFFALAVPKGTPEEIIELLATSFKTAVDGDEFVNFCNSIGVTPVSMSREEVNDYINGVQERAFTALDELKAKGLI